MDIPSTPCTGIHPWLRQGDRLSAELYLDDKSVGSFDYFAKHEGMLREPAFKFNIPAKAGQLKLSGKLTMANGKVQPFSRVWRVRDLAPYTAPLLKARCSRYFSASP